MALSRRLTIAPELTRPSLRLAQTHEKFGQALKAHIGDALLCLPVFALAFITLSEDAGGLNPHSFSYSWHYSA
jgi:hypothetical protein